MSRTRLRIVLILLALILVVASILSGLLTRWVGALGSPASNPEDGEAGQPLLASRRTLRGTLQPGCPAYQPLPGPFVAG